MKKHETKYNFAEVLFNLKKILFVEVTNKQNFYFVKLYENYTSKRETNQILNGLFLGSRETN
ncbi:hypothetical protein BpHYR1_046521 [Brachionus plicatilis]|uniref:Uncharacterized protein n=1 Tax=Brachionus plicatilis TaxID=10195 RepID=A0A3M7QTB6_BRAPC|nr:hypothetical protein BpHYR1_046521 [Brachionus plicatilis]